MRKGIVTRNLETSGYTNLWINIPHHHEDEILSRILIAKKRTFSVFKSITYPRKCFDAYGLIESIIMCLLPFGLYENYVMPKHLNYDAMHRKSFMNYMQNITRLVEKVIRDGLPNRFAMTFDGWAEGDTNFVSVFAVFYADNVNGYDLFLFACSPMANEESINTN